MKRLGIALILTCALSVSALAGDIPTIGVASPPPPAPGETSTPPGATQGQSLLQAIILTMITWPR